MSKKAIVIYNSKRGSTKQYAEWIAGELGCTSVSLENLDYGSLGQFDVVIFGSWLRGSGIVGFDKFRKQITDFALTYLNTPYIWGSTGPKSFDCSGFVNYVYKEIATVQLPRTSYNIAKLKNKVEKDDLQIGDIIYFKTTKKKRISHVGIYIGDNKFVHASSAKKKVVISEIEGFYKRAYRGAVRPY